MQKENCFSSHFRVQSKFGEAKCTKIIWYLTKNFQNIWNFAKKYIP